MRRLLSLLAALFFSASSIADGTTHPGAPGVKIGVPIIINSDTNRTLSGSDLLGAAIVTRTNTGTVIYTLPATQADFGSGKYFTAMDQDATDPAGKIEIALPDTQYQLLEYTSAIGRDIISSGARGDSVTIMSIGDYDADGDTDLVVLGIRGSWVDNGL